MATRNARQTSCASMSVLPQLSNVRNAGTATVPCGLTLECIKEATGKFAVETIFKLSLTNRGLQDMCGMDCLANLVELDLSNNAITHVTGLDSLGNLRKLVLRCNRIRTIDGLSCTIRLEHLFLQGNQLSTVESLNLAMLSNLERLRSVYFKNIDGSEACPVCSQKEYKAAVLSALPRLTNLDGERNPHSCCYHDALVQTHKAHEVLKEYQPEFKHVLPDHWFTQAELEVPTVTAPTAPGRLCTTVRATQERLSKLEHAIGTLQQRVFDRAKSATNVTE
eukprot:jgi/Ulvmu1/11878/UM081_0036.1